MTKKYIVTEIEDVEIQPQEALLDLKDWENEENDRYKGVLKYEGTEIIYMEPEAFEFDKFPTLDEVKEVMHKVFRSHVGSMHITTEGGKIDSIDIVDTETLESVSDEDEIREWLSYEGKYKIYIGDIKGIEVDEE